MKKLIITTIALLTALASADSGLNFSDLVNSVNDKSNFKRLSDQKGLILTLQENGLFYLEIIQNIKKNKQCRVFTDLELADNDIMISERYPQLTLKIHDIGIVEVIDAGNLCGESYSISGMYYNDDKVRAEAEAELDNALSKVGL